jgi:hypothetical protein
MRFSSRRSGSGRVLSSLSGVLVMLVAYWTPGLSAQKPAKGDQKPADAASQAQAQAQQQEIQNLVRIADAAMSGQPAPTDFPVQFQNDFLKAQGSRVWVPVTLTLDPSKMSSPAPALTVYLRVVPRGMTAPPPPAAEPAKDAKDKDKKDKKGDKNAPAAAPTVNYPFEDAQVLDAKPATAGQPLRILRGIGVPAGSYDLYVVLHERVNDPSQGRGVVPTAPGKTSVLKQPLDVPNFAAGEFSTSTVILAERVDQLPAPIPPDQQSERPYAFGQTEIVVSPDHKFKKSQELIVLLQIYNPMLSPEKKFNLEATYTFYKTEGGTEKRFNATEPQTFNNETMGAGFDPAGSSSIQAGQGVPLQSFPDGNYRLEIKITDKLSTKVLTQNVNFTVTP